MRCRCRCKPVVRGVTFRAPAGSFTALVGPSGAGKTTIAYLLARLYDADQGVVSIDGLDVRGETRWRAWRCCRSRPMRASR